MEKKITILKEILHAIKSTNSSNLLVLIPLLDFGSRDN